MDIKKEVIPYDITSIIINQNNCSYELAFLKDHYLRTLLKLKAIFITSAVFKKLKLFFYYSIIIIC